MWREMLMIKIALIDSGINNKLIDAEHRILFETTFDAQLNAIVSNRTSDDNGHGTFCANLILSRTSFSVIQSIKILNSNLKSSSELLIAALRTLINSDINIINLSLSTSNFHYSNHTVYNLNSP